MTKKQKGLQKGYSDLEKEQIKLINNICDKWDRQNNIKKKGSDK